MPLHGVEEQVYVGINNYWNLVKKQEKLSWFSYVIFERNQPERMIFRLKHRILKTQDKEAYMFLLKVMLVPGQKPGKVKNIFANS